MRTAFVSAIAGAMLLLSACGDGSAPEPAQPTATEPGKATEPTTLVAALGDSITAGSPLWDPSPAIREQIGPAADPASQFEFWATETSPALEFRNCGVFGERTDEIAARLDGCADGADALIVQGGINNIAQGGSVDDAAADLRSMVIAGQGLGLEVAIAEVLPWNNGYPTADPAIKRLNRLIGEIAAEEGAALMPFYEALEDAENPGRMALDLTDDGDHPSIEGYRLLGRETVAPTFTER